MDAFLCIAGPVAGLFFGYLVGSVFVAILNGPPGGHQARDPMPPGARPPRGGTGASRRRP